MWGAVHTVLCRAALPGHTALPTSFVQADQDALSSLRKASIPACTLGEVGSQTGTTHDVVSSVLLSVAMLAVA